MGEWDEQRGIKDEVVRGAEEMMRGGKEEEERKVRPGKAGKRRKGRKVGEERCTCRRWISGGREGSGRDV